MKVLVFCTYPLEAASTRYRLIQFIEPLAEKNIHLTVIPFLTKRQFADLYKPGNIFRKAVQILSSTKKRLFDSINIRNFDAVLIQREAMLFGPPIFEWLAKSIGRCPLILDLDDATYIRYISPTYGRLGSALKFFGKTDTLINWSQIVICGNPQIAEYVKNKGKKAVIVPTVVDTGKFCPVKKDCKTIPVLGWIGTHSTFPFLESLFPVFTDLTKKYDFVLKIVGSGKEKVEIKDVKVENLDWDLPREIKDFQSLDIGLYPMQVTNLVSHDWLMGKSGFKAIQYMSVGIPFVVTPVGITSEIGIENETHFTAVNNVEWYDALAKLLESADLRKQMGKNGRDYALKNYTILQQAEIITSVLYEAIEDFA